MKANEAPRKIYIPTAGDEIHYHMTCSKNEFKESIEYTRTDAFIEKATWWLLTNASDYVALHNGYDIKELVKDFVDAMKRD